MLEMIKSNFFLLYQTLTNSTRIKHDNNANITQLSGTHVFMKYLGKKTNQKNYDEKQKKTKMNSRSD